MTKKDILRMGFSQDRDNIFIVTIRKGKEYKIYYDKLTETLQSSIFHSVFKDYIHFPVSISANYFYIIEQ